MNRVLACGMILLMSIFTNGCSTEDGKDGANGAPGTANVIYSGWIIPPVAVAETIDGTAGLSTSINVPQLTQEILDSGTILVYMKFGSFVVQLPYTSVAGGSVSTVTSISILQKIKIFRFKHANDGTTVGLPTSLNYRYILIPGGVAASNEKSKKIDYSKMTYEEVCTYLNIIP